MRREGPVRVLVVDGSPLFRTRLRSALQAEPGLIVLPGATNTADAREAVLTHKPDIIVLDLDLVRGDALAFLKKLRDHYPVPVFVSTRSAEQRGPQVMRAIEMGALDVVHKGFPDRAAEAARFARLADEIREAYAHARPVPPPRVRESAPPASWREAGLHPERHLVAIGASTGGTEAIRALLSHAPPDFPPTVITQHMPAGFTRSFAERLDAVSPLRVTEAVDGQVIGVGEAVVARGDTHLEVRRAARGWRCIYTHQRPVNNHCPSVDVMFHAVAEHAAEAAAGVLLTGMGADGAQGLLEIRTAGGVTLAQDRASCVVWGMPKAAVDLKAPMDVGEPPSMPGRVLALLQNRAPCRTAP